MMMAEITLDFNGTHCLVRLWHEAQVEDPCHPRSLRLSDRLQTHPWTPGHPSGRRSSPLPGPGHYSVKQTPVKKRHLSLSINKWSFWYKLFEESVLILQDKYNILQVR